MGEESLVLVLIHGTYAPNADWTQDNSPFVLGLKKKVLTIQKVHRVIWSGNNSFAARREAARSIITFLASLNATEKALVCAHSHGGGALCYALQERPDLADKIKGAAFLGTPFLDYRLLPSRHALLDGYFTPFVVAWIATLTAAPIAIITCLAKYLDVSSSGVLRLLFIALSLLAIELSLQLLIKLNRYKVACSRRILTDAGRTAKLVSCDLPLDLDAIFIRMSGDEAAMALNFTAALLRPTTFANAWYGRIFTAIITPYRLIKIRKPVGDRLEIYFFSVVFFGLIYFDIMYLAWFLFALTGTYLAVSYFILTMNWMISNSLGGMTFVRGAIIQPAVEPVPPGTWQLNHVPWRFSDRPEDEPHRLHSRIHDDPKIIDSIVRWISRSRDAH
jgi:pimeloyl-ACP methyl ester carboxylesterase